MGTLQDRVTSFFSPKEGLGNVSQYYGKSMPERTLHLFDDIKDVLLWVAAGLASVFAWVFKMQIQRITNLETGQDEIDLKIMRVFVDIAAQFKLHNEEDRKRHEDDRKEHKADMERLADKVDRHNAAVLTKLDTIIKNGHTN